MAEDGRSMMEPKNSSSSDPNPCPICLGPITQDSYLDQCFHKFCFNCIVRWTNTVASKHSCRPSSLKCPLCKTENLSIIYGYDGSSFQQHYINRDLRISEFFSEAHRYRLKCYYIEPGNLADKLNVLSYWKFRKYRQQNHWLHEWLRREIQAVTQEEDVDVIVHHILGVIDSFRRDEVKHSYISTETKQEAFKLLVSQAVGPFLTGRSDRFVNELELFLASGLKIDAFDRVYIKHLGWKIPEISIEEEDSDETPEHEPAVPYLYILDQDSDDN
ncbi:RING/U-box superfamily protein [Forsythia ovata]|uniref:RING/U-box superfamily protein n=1 Tax=Forsythia ovata TaxID=205694 RepID=A0ABD1Q1E6_9LAMI